MATHSMKLDAVPFAMIAAGTKTIDARLHDSKRRTVNLGDIILFRRADDDTQVVGARVIGLLRYATFHDLFSYNDPKKFGSHDVGSLLAQIGVYYTQADQARYGVVGIEISRL